MKAKLLLILALITLSNCAWSIDLNCQSKGLLGFLGCLLCRSNFFVSPTGGCKSIHMGANCVTYNMKSGNCLTCPASHTLVFGVCVPSAAASNTFVQNPNCKTSDSTAACLSCWKNYYLSSGKCVLGNPLCATYDNSGTGACASCLGPAFYLNSSGQCVVGNGNCATYTSTGTCATCWANSPFYIDAEKNCVLVDTSCKTWNSNGNCLTCWIPTQVATGRKCQ